MAARRDGNYLKEIFGTILWIALIYFLFRGDGVGPLREFLENVVR